MLKLIFCGDRHWKDKYWINRVMSILKDNLGDFVVIEGEAKGADSISKMIAKHELHLPVDPYPAHWTEYGLAAGPIRNKQMLREGKADGVVAFHLNIEESKGTRDMVCQGRRAKIPVWICTEGPDALAQFILRLKRRQHGKDQT